MRFNRRFERQGFKNKAFTPKFILGAIFMWVIITLIIYSFFYVLRETERMFFLDLENRPYLIPDGDRRLYNLFFSAISAILGSSIVLSFLFSKPQNLISNRFTKRLRIINDQIFLNLNFIHWFAKVWFLFGTFSHFLLGPDFLSTFWLISVMLIIVLYLDSWKTIRSLLRSSRWKIQLIHFFGFVIITVGVASVEIIDYKSIDERAYRLHPTIHVPESLFADNRNGNYWDNSFLFKMYEGDNSNKVELYTGNNIPINDFVSFP